jgi:hypothetical protein
MREAPKEEVTKKLLEEGNSKGTDEEEFWSSKDGFSSA